ncbi:MAG: hypothetical protein AAF799_28945 [Myxococcota bacterium]
MAKGRTWCIDFQTAATKAGDVSVKYRVKLPNGMIQELNGSWQGYPIGMTPDAKATRFFRRLSTDPNMSSLVNVSRAGNTVCFQLKDGAPYDDIEGIEVGDETGQIIHTYDDPPPADTSPLGPLDTVRLVLSPNGRRSAEGGNVWLGIGVTAPLVCVPTRPEGGRLDVAAVIEAIVRAFNEAYAELGYEAAPGNDGEVIIPEVPCKLGVRGGTDDPDLSSSLGLVNPAAGGFERPFSKADALRAALEVIDARLRRTFPHTAAGAGMVTGEIALQVVGGTVAACPNPYDDVIAELEGIKGTLERLKKGRTDAQKKALEEARTKIQEAIDGLEKMRDSDPNAPSEGDIQKALRDAADKIDEANPNRRNGSLRRQADALRDIERNLF